MGSDITDRDICKQAFMQVCMHLLLCNQEEGLVSPSVLPGLRQKLPGLHEPHDCGRLHHKELCLELQGWCMARCSGFLMSYVRVSHQ